MFKSVNLHDLIQDNNVTQILKVISEDPLILDRKDESGRTLLHWACSKGLVELVRYLVAHKQDPKLPDDSEWTPLMIATSCGHEELVQYLLGLGVDVNCRNNTGQTCLHYAASKNHLKILQLLLENGADPNIADCAKTVPLQRAISKDNDTVICLLLDGWKNSAKSSIDNKDMSGQTPLHYACYENNLKAIDKLHQLGARFDIEDKEGKKPIDLAQERIQKSLIQKYMHSSDYLITR
ncbi:Ankyrin-2 [Cichlidogyrus casuarinus]|uniref:Ankyrin-2 n=1 Tax=Cichlidogyrus casuarinus TaxID=1844966 RepID=A0ABD2Q0Q6_9PLAT